MSLTANQEHHEPVVPTTRAASPRRGHARFCRAGLVVVALLGTSVLIAACGGSSSGRGVASMQDSTTTTGPSTAPSGGTASPTDRLLAYVGCVRTHGEPDMPEPTIEGSSMHLSVTPGSGIDPNSPQFTAANNACQHLLMGKGGAGHGNAITPADQADYLNAAACMRSHGVANFPDPVFQNNNVTFNNQTPIDTNSSQYQSGLAICEKLIPAGLPYSSPGDS